MQEDEEACNVRFASSVITLILSFLILTIPTLDYAIKPLFRDGSIISLGRYSMMQDALDSVQDDQVTSVIALGSSMMFKAFNGSCFDLLDGRNDVRYYNLAIPNSRPYNDMLHIPKIIQANPEIVLIEVGVNALNEPNPSANEYLEFRYRMDTMQQDDSNLGGWVDILDGEYGDWLATNQIERQIFKQRWFPESIEELSRRFVLNESGVYPFGTYAQIPDPGSPEWMNFLQEPEWPPVRFDRMNPQEAEHYNNTEMADSASLYHPTSMETLSHQAIDYMVEELSAAGIEIVLTTLPHHPLVFRHLEPGQWDPLNETIDQYEIIEGVTVLENTWSTGWRHEHFDDRNHLDADGRIEFCNRHVTSLAGLLDK